MAAIDLSQISSNWKKLQASQQSGGKDKSNRPDVLRSSISTKALKRKRPELDSSDKPRAPKKPKPNSIRAPSQRTPKMGTSQSTPPPPSRTLLDDHDLTRSDLTAAYGPSSSSSSSVSFRVPLSLPSDALNTGQHPTHKAGKFLALDCEMVGTGPPPATTSLLARVSLVNYNYEQIYDSYVQPPPGIPVTDYRTHVSGILPAHLTPEVARPIDEVQTAVAGLLRDRVLVGHALRNDLAVLGFGHPRRDVRDTGSGWKPFRMNGGAPRLRDLALRELGVTIQGGEHSSLEDARAAMGLFRKVKGEWEAEVRRRFGAPRAKGQQGKGGKGRRGRDGREEEGEGEEEEDEEEEGLDFLTGEEEDGVEEMDEEGKVDTGAGQNRKKKRKKKKRTKRK